MGVSAGPLEVKIEVAQLSDPGRDPNKQINEDSCGYAQTKFGHLCVLCDGMGGHYGGQEASRRAITTIFEQIEQASDAVTPREALKFSIEVAARRVYELGGPVDNKVRPGSTVVAMLLHDTGLEVAHVGDSRAYVIRSGQIYPLTRDHSMVQAMIDAGFLTEDQAIGHPDANKITRALGMKPDVEVEVRPEPMELFAGDVLLTASDGLTDLALGKDILGATRQALASGGIEHACQQLVRMANDRGGHDNITVQLVRVVHTGARRTKTGATLLGAAGATTMDDDSSTVLGAPPPISSSRGPTSAGPTSVDPSRARAETLSMQAASTAHDGTSHASHAASMPASISSQPGYAAAPHPGSVTLQQAPMSGAISAHGQHVAGHGMGAVAAQGLQLPPNPQPISPTLSQSLEQPRGMADYRLDGVGGLQLPPVSTRYVGQQGIAQGQPMPAQGSAGPRQTPNMSPSPPPAVASSPGYGGPQDWQGQQGHVQGGAVMMGASPAPQPGAHAPGEYRVPPIPASQTGRMSLVDSAGGRMGGNVLFLALTISFVVAVVVLSLVWLLFLR